MQLSRNGVNSLHRKRELNSVKIQELEKAYGEDKVLNLYFIGVSFLVHVFKKLAGDTRGQSWHSIIIRV